MRGDVILALIWQQQELIMGQEGDPGACCMHALTIPYGEQKPKPLISWIKLSAIVMMKMTFVVSCC